MIFFILKSFFSSVIKRLYKLKGLYVIKKKNPTLRLIGSDSFIENTEFGKHNSVRDSYLSNSSFGDYSYVSIKSSIWNACVGKFTCIGPRVSIGLPSHPYEFVSLHPAFYSKSPPSRGFTDVDCFDEYEDTIIGNDVWIGANVMVIGGVEIGDGAIVAAGAVVTKSVEPYTIVGGVPAKYIRHRFPHDTVSALKKLEWWNMSLSELEDHHTLFQDVKNISDILILKNQINEQKE